MVIGNYDFNENLVVNFGLDFVFWTPTQSLSKRQKNSLMSKHPNISNMSNMLRNLEKITNDYMDCISNTSIENHIIVTVIKTSFL